MVLNVIDYKIRQAFSGAALHYDVLSSLHREIGRELTSKIQMLAAPYARILDVGMGTGWLTDRLTQFFPDAEVIGMDVAPGMIVEAKKRAGLFKIVQADAANLPFRSQSFDLITSNLAYQWVRDLRQSFVACHTLLQPEGFLCLTMFGYNTFSELFESFKQVSGNELAISRLAKRDTVEQILLDSRFKGIETRQERIKVRFPDMLGLMKWIKDIGANALPRDVYIGRDLLVRANEYYNSHFTDRLGVYATLEVIWIEARK